MSAGTLEIARIAGSPPTLVFLHEGLGSRSAWRDFPSLLAGATGRAAIVGSRAGYGRSPLRPTPWPVDFMHDEARQALPALLAAEGIDDAILVGHSDGASIALLYAGELGAGVRALVLEAPHVFVEDQTVASIAALAGPYADGELRQRLGRHHDDVDATFSGWRGVWLDPAFRRWNIEGALAGVRVPTLVIQGEDDEYGTVAQLEAVRRGVAGSCETLLLPECSHAPHRDQPARTLAAMADFIARVSR
jgi:pimeloyl-ACP methyl ester carboxylesterase